MSRVVLRQLFFGSHPGPFARRRPPALRVESLEARANPVIASLSAAGLLSIDGSTAFNDRILVRQDGGVIGVFDASSGAAFVVPISTPGGTVNFVPVGQVTGIDVDGFSGNDFIDLNSAAAGFTPITLPATVRGGAGFDSLAGGNGNDQLVGGDDADLVFGNIGDDSLDGGLGNDTLFGGSDNDTVVGGADDDRLTGDFGSDSLLGGDGNDTLLDADGDDTLLGGLGNDRLSGSFGADFLFGEGGNDSLFGGSGNDSLSGGTGDD
ncbi:MAG TPA: calcium-binding protein, partial [Gemmataceae bacterium]|nr:calcium-binding protein [Gemmataceae bacterium]